MELYLQATRLSFRNTRVNVAVTGHGSCKPTRYFQISSIFVSEMKLHAISYPKRLLDTFIDAEILTSTYSTEH